MDLNKSDVDRISSLPDSLIHHILSFLHIKHVAQISVLSKRWSYIWITVPILKFDSSRFGKPSCLDFMDFIDGTLHRRHKAANIQRFSITGYTHLNESRLNSWITSAVRHGVQHLSLYLVQKKPLIITRSLFTCESLISLKLQITPDFFCFPTNISFPKLKRLVLEGVVFSNKYWNENLFSNSNFPVLEDLELEHCTWFGMPNFCVSNSALNHFGICNWDENWLPLEEDDGLRGCTLKVNAPNLKSFYYNASIAKEYVLTFPLLVKATVDFRFKQYVAAREQRIGHVTALIQFLRALANVKCLRVCDDTLQALSFADDLLKKLPTFHNNTKKLVMLEEVTSDKALVALVALLKATANLESLVFGKLPPDDEDDVAGSDADAAEGKNNHGSEEDAWTLDMVTDPECLFRHLKSVYFEEFTGNPVDMSLVKLVLKNANVLQTMSISNFHHSYLLKTERKEELMAEIPNLPRASTSCVFDFSSWDVDEDSEDDEMDVDEDSEDDDEDGVSDGSGMSRPTPESSSRLCRAEDGSGPTNGGVSRGGIPPITSITFGKGRAGSNASVRGGGGATGANGSVRGRGGATGANGSVRGRGGPTGANGSVRGRGGATGASASATGRGGGTGATVRGRGGATDASASATGRGGGTSATVRGRGGATDASASATGRGGGTGTTGANGSVRGRGGATGANGSVRGRGGPTGANGSVRGRGGATGASASATGRGGGTGATVRGRGGATDASASATGRGGGTGASVRGSVRVGANASVSGRGGATGVSARGRDGGTGANASVSGRGEASGASASATGSGGGTGASVRGRVGATGASATGRGGGTGASVIGRGGGIRAI